VETIIYVETTIASFYTETRDHEEIRVRRKWTREWWDRPKDGQALVTSSVVINELKRIPDVSRRDQALALVTPLEQVPYDDEVAELAELYIRHRVMPREMGGDADHLALASLRRCDMLVTWNCRHLANANKMAHIRRVNAQMELPTPLLVTPMELMERFQ
jgi:hypothetical protein